jgi:hypothetical protein
MPCRSWLAGDDARTNATNLYPRNTGKLVVDLISDNATIEFTS